LSANCCQIQIDDEGTNVTTLRVLAILLLTAIICFSQSDQSKVEALLQQMERAEQTGDFNAWKALWTSEKSGEIEKMRPYATARPSVQYHALNTFVHGDQAVILVQAASDSFITMMLRREGGDWKIQDEVWGDTQPDAKSVYALVPPDPGAFARAGSPWNQVAPGLDPAQAASQGWQLKAAFDESYLYIRIESSDRLPAPGSTIEKPPGDWPVLKIDTSNAGEFVLYDAVNVGDQATFDEHGKANSHRAFASYTIRLEQKDHAIFTTYSGLDSSPLIKVAGRNYDIRIPLAAMGIMDSRATQMTIGDAQWPKSAVVSIAAQRYPR
jgi:hypothetical protein